MSDLAFGDEGDAAPLRAATRFGPYVLCYELASGGMGAVFLAKAEGPRGFEKLVALKRIHPHLARDPRFSTMFLDEARIAARIHHPNVCGVHEFGEVDGTYYLTMPYLVGEPLHRVLREGSRATGPLLEDRPWMIARVIVDACEGLHAAHELRDESGQLLEVVHRDVSPQNLFLGYDGSARVLDFGVASARHRHYQTSTGEVKGKFAYLAPEQLEGHAADRRVDVWALGVVLWEGLTGRRLFARENMAASVRAVSHDPIPPLRELVDLPDELQRVVDRALARDRDARYPTAREMGRELLTALSRHRVVGPADVGEWLQALFPNGRAEGERLVEESRVLSLDEVSGIALTAGGATGTMTVRESELSADEAPDDSRDDSHRGASPTRVPRAPVDRSASDASSRRASALGATVGVAHRRSDGVAEPTEATPLVAARAPRRPQALVWIAVALVVASAVIGGLLLTSSEPSTAPTSTGTATPLATSPRATPPNELGADPPRADALAEPRPGDPLSATPSSAVTAPSTTDGPVRSTALSPSDDPTPDAPEAPVEAPSAEERTASEPSEERAARDARPGRLQIATPGGWALVFRGRTRLGESPGTFVLPAGTHDVGIQPLGEGPIRRRRVVIPAGGTTRLSIPIR